MKKPKKSMKQLVKEANEALLDPYNPDWAKGTNRILKAIGLKVRFPEGK